MIGLPYKFGLFVFEDKAEIRTMAGMPDYYITEFSAKNDNRTNNSSAIQAAIDACHDAGGGRVVIPAGGAFITGTIELRAHVELHLENGAVLRASHSPADYRSVTMAGEYGGNEGSFLIQANDAPNVAITGNGTIDGQGDAFLDGWWTDDGPYIKKPKAFRPRVIGLFGCKNLRINGITILNAPQWSCHLTGCEDVVIHGITILNGLDVPNCDGIDPDHCRNVRISDCHIEAGDDGIVIKTTRDFNRYGASENITVSGCTIISTSAAIKIGTESHNDISNVTVTNCVIRQSHRGLAIQLRDHGNVENVIFSNCIVETRQFHPKWWGNAEAIYLTAVPRHATTKVGTIRNVLCSNIMFRGENGVFIHGTEESPVRNVTLSNVHGELRKTSKFPINFYDLRPYLSQEHGGLEQGQLGGITACHVDGLSIQNCSISKEDPENKHWSQSEIFSNVTRLSGSFKTEPN